MTFSRSTLVRVLPFAALMALLAVRGAAPADGACGFDPRWLYGATVPVVGAMLAPWCRDHGELARHARWR
jgi:hypothetical protein